MVINASFSWPLLGNRPPLKLNGLKQPSFYLLMILWVSSLGEGQALRGNSAALSWGLRLLQSPQLVGAASCKGLADFLNTCCFLCLISVFSSFHSSLRNIKKVLDIVENSILSD